MPIINGKFYLNPAAGAALERARSVESDGTAQSQRGGVNQRDSRGRFVPPGPVHRVEIEAADGGYIAHVHRQPPDGNPFGPLSGGLPPHPTSHIFGHHNDLVEFLRQELSKR